LEKKPVKLIVSKVMYVIRLLENVMLNLMEHTKQKMLVLKIAKNPNLNICVIHQLENVRLRVQGIV
jgi:hypothetical protein